MHTLTRLLITIALVCAFTPTAIAQQKTMAAKGGDAVQMLKQKGATFGPMTPRLNKLKASGDGSVEYHCDSVACWCTGGGDCLNLIDAKGGKCKHFVCGNDQGTPVCWCDL